MTSNKELPYEYLGEQMEQERKAIIDASASLLRLLHKHHPQLAPEVVSLDDEKAWTKAKAIGLGVGYRLRQRSRI